MTEAGKRLLAAAHEALTFARGEAEPGTYIVHAPPPAVDVKAIRNKMGMTQAEFGARFGFGKSRIRDWEQQRTRPAASDRVLLVTIAAHPDSVLRALELHDDDQVGVKSPVAASVGTSRRKAVKKPSAKPKIRTIAQKSATG